MGLLKPGTYEKKPVRIQAAQWEGEAYNATPIIDWILENGGTARYVGEGEDHPMRYPDEREVINPRVGNAQRVRSDAPEFIVIDTLEGAHRANVEDWVIKGVRKPPLPPDFYPCKPDVFDMTYEEVDDE